MTLSELRDFVSSRDTFIMTLDNILQMLDKMNNKQDKIRALKARLFYCSDRKDRIPYLVELAICYGAADRLNEAEEAIVEALTSIAKTHKAVYDLETPSIRTEIERLAFLMADLYREMDIKKGDGLSRLDKATDFFSSNPARILFKYHFLVKLGELRDAYLVLDLMLMDEKERIFLLELMAQCCQMLDDLPHLQETYKAIAYAFDVKGIDLEERSLGLLALAMEDRKNADLILEIGLTKSYKYKLDHCLSLLDLALKNFPDDSRFPWLASRVYRLDHQPQEAQKSLEVALELNPSDFKAGFALKHLKENLEAKMIPAHDDGALHEE